MQLEGRNLIMRVIETAGLPILMVRQEGAKAQ